MITIERINTVIACASGGAIIGSYNVEWSIIGAILGGIIGFLQVNIDFERKYRRV